MQALAGVQVTEGTFKLKGQSKNHMIYISLAMLLIHGAPPSSSVTSASRRFLRRRPRPARS